MTKKKDITEKQVVDNLIANWDKYFDDIKFQRKEWNMLSWYRADILAYIDLNLKDTGHTEEDQKYRASMVIEIKYDSECRDLIYEIQKAMQLRDRLAKNNRPFYIGVVMDSYNDPVINNFLIDNDIHTWIVNIKDDDLETMTVEYIELKEKPIERME